MRIIAGAAKGRGLVAPKGRDVRPTADRVKEALFSSLQPLLPAASVLDLYAGAGGLGLEALSRGAAAVTFVERDKRAFEALRRNVDAVGLEPVETLYGDVRAVLVAGRVPGEPFDLVLADPPYDLADEALGEVLHRLVRHLAAAATVVVERPAWSAPPPWPVRLLPALPRRYGDTILHRARLEAAKGPRMSVAAVCPGSFDPITMGHLDIVARAAACFDRVVVAVLENPSKTALFSVEERIDLIRGEIGRLDNVEVDRFQGLLVDFCNDRGISVVCKGLRAVSDFEYELQMAQMNRRIGAVETLFMSTSPEHSYLSSSLVKEVARYGGPLDGTVPDRVAAALEAKFA